MVRFFSVLFSLAISFSGCAAVQENEALSLGQIRTGKIQYNIETYAEFMGLSRPQYFKFMSAIDAHKSAISAGPGFVLSQHSALVQLRNLHAKGEEIPEALSDEVERVFIEYNSGLAKFMGVTLNEYQELVRKFSDLMITMRGLDEANFRLSDPDYKTQSSSGDDIEHVEIVATEQVIRETSSGGFTSLIGIIWTAGIDSFQPGQFVADVSVTFVSSNSNFVGTQTFRVTRGDVRAITNISCNGESCSLSQF